MKVNTPRFLYKFNPIKLEIITETEEDVYDLINLNLITIENKNTFDLLNNISDEITKLTSTVQ